MSGGDYLVGLIFFAGTTGAVVAAAGLVVRARLSHLPVSTRILAGGIVATAGVIAVHLLPGLLGLLSRGAALGCALAALAAATRTPRAPAVAPSPEPSPSGERRPWLVVAAAGLLYGAWALAALWNATVAPATDIDSLTFHLPNIASWVQSGTFWRVDQFTPLLANGNYPQNGDVIFLAAVLPWENDAFVRLVNLPFVGLAGLSVYAIAAELRAPRAAGALFAMVFVATPAVSFAAFEGAKTDIVMFATFGSGLLFLIRHLRTRSRTDLVLAGVGLGVAFGTKWYGVTGVPIVVIVWMVVSLVTRRGPVAVLRRGAAVTGIVAAFGGFWLVRNLVESGNPVFPVNVQLAGVTLFDAPRDFIRECAGFRIVDYVGTPGVWPDFILPAYRDNYALPGLLIVAMFVIAIIMLVRAPASSRRHAGLARDRVAQLALLSVTAAGLAAAYAATPYSAFGPEGEPLLVGANTRWALPAFLVAATLGAWAAGRLGRARVALEVVALLAVADGVRRGFPISLREAVRAAAGAAVAGGVAYGLIRLSPRLGPRPAMAGRVGLAFVTVLMVVVVGHERQERFNEGRYAGGDPSIDWIAKYAPSGHRIGLAGVWSVEGLSPVLPAFGPRLDNRVAFVGEFVGGQLRELETRAGFAAAVRRGGYDLLIVGRAGYSGCQVPGAEGDENAFASAEGFVKLAESDRLTLYRVPIAPIRDPKPRSSVSEVPVAGGAASVRGAVLRTRPGRDPARPLPSAPARRSRRTPPTTVSALVP